MKKYLILKFLLYVVITANAQSGVITGVVLDEDENPASGVNIIIKDTINSTITDIDGKFTLEIQDGQNEIEIVYIGYHKQTIDVSNLTNVRIVLQLDESQIYDVVEIALGGPKKKNHFADFIYEKGIGKLYFPDYNGYFADDWRSINNRYSKHLYSLGEPVLYKKTNQKKNIIRFTNFDRRANPYSYRIEQRGSVVSVTYNKTGTWWNYGAGKIIEHDKIEISIDKWNAIVSKINSIDFWSIDTHYDNKVLDEVGWVIEVLIEGRYHFISRADQETYADLRNLITEAYETEK